MDGDARDYLMEDIESARECVAESYGDNLEAHSRVQLEAAALVALSNYRLTYTQ